MCVYASVRRGGMNASSEHRKVSPATFSRVRHGQSLPTTRRSPQCPPRPWWVMERDTGTSGDFGDAQIVHSKETNFD